MIPIIGWVTRWGFGAIPIDRSNRYSIMTVWATECSLNASSGNALKSLKHLANAVHYWGRSIAISPEGTRSHSGQLGPFKKGPFYLQEDVNLPISPVLIVNAFELWPRSRAVCVSGRALMLVLPPFIPDSSKSRDENRLLLRRKFLRATMDLVPNGTDTSAKPTISFKMLCHGWRVFVWVIIAQLFLVIKPLVSTYNVVALGFIGLVVETMMYASC